MNSYIFWSFLVALLCVLFSNSLHNDFAFDDFFAIVDNADAVGNSGWSNLLKNDYWGQNISQETSHKSYRPVTIISFRLNYYLHEYLNTNYKEFYKSFTLSGLERTQERKNLNLYAETYHIVNIILHGLVTIFVGIFFKRVADWSKVKVEIYNGLLPGWFIATLLFLAHPVHVEAVTGLVGRAELICALFVMMALYVWFSILTNSATANFIVASTKFIFCILLFYLSVFSKETGFTLVGLFVVMEYLILSRNFRDMIFFWKRPKISSFFVNSSIWAGIGASYLLFRNWLTVHFTVLIYRQVFSLQKHPKNFLRFLD